MGMKKLSTHCNVCGVGWLPDLSNKKDKRSICLECGRKEQREQQQKKRLPVELHRRNKFAEFKGTNRNKHWAQINKDLSKIKDRNEWRKYFEIRFNEILSNDLLWEYIRTDYDDNKKQNTK
jgi:uncharacterized Zn finger protein (UPF0148 family)